MDNARALQATVELGQLFIRAGLNMDQFQTKELDFLPGVEIKVRLRKGEGLYSVSLSAQPPKKVSANQIQLFLLQLPLWLRPVHTDGWLEWQDPNDKRWYTYNFISNLGGAAPLK